MLQALAAAGSRLGRDLAAASATCARSSVRAAGSRCSGGGANAQSTAWAVQGLLAAGVSPAKVRKGGRTPFDYLASLQAADGHYRYSRSSDQTPVWVTAQALQAVERAAVPASPRSRGGTASAGVGVRRPTGAAGAIRGRLGGRRRRWRRCRCGRWRGGGRGGGAAAAEPGAGGHGSGGGIAGPLRDRRRRRATPALLVGGVVLGLAVIVACGVMLNRQSARESRRAPG